MGTVSETGRRSADKQTFHLCSALEYIDELLTLLTKHDEVQISENISEEVENIKVGPHAVIETFSTLTVSSSASQIIAFTVTSSPSF